MKVLRIRNLRIHPWRRANAFIPLLFFTGFYVALGFCDKLRYMTVSINDLVQTRELPIRNCTVCCFSTNGHLFAAANRNVIQIFSTLSFQNMYNLRGHFGKVNIRSGEFMRISWMSTGGVLIDMDACVICTVVVSTKEPKWLGWIFRWWYPC